MLRCLADRRLERAAFLLIDAQQGFADPTWGKRTQPEAEMGMKTLLEAFRAAALPVIHVQHLSDEPASPLRPGQRGAEFMEETRPRQGERVFQKTVNCAFIGTGLEAHLRAKALQVLVMAGFTTDHCISTSARVAANLGFDVLVVSDATVAFARAGIGTTYPPEIVHEVSLASLRGEFAEIASVSEVVNALAKRCGRARTAPPLIEINR